MRSDRDGATEAIPGQAPDHGATARSHHQVRAADHAQGQGAERRPRSAADAHLDPVPQVPGRHGADRGGAGGARGTGLPRHRGGALSLAGLGGPGGRHHRSGPPCLPRRRMGGTAGRHPRRGAVRVPSGLARRGRWRRGAPRRDRDRVPGLHQPDGERLPAPGRRQPDRRHPLRLVGGDPHPGPPLRDPAPRDAGRGGRLRRVLHPSPRGAFHGRGYSTRGSGRPSSIPRAARAGSSSKPSGTSRSRPTRSRSARSSRSTASWASRPSRCPSCWPR